MQQITAVFHDDRPWTHSDIVHCTSPRIYPTVWSLYNSCPGLEPVMWLVAVAGSLLCVIAQLFSSGMTAKLKMMLTELQAFLNDVDAVSTKKKKKPPVLWQNIILYTIQYIVLYKQMCIAYCSWSPLHWGSVYDIILEGSSVVMASILLLAKATHWQVTVSWATVCPLVRINVEIFGNYEKNHAVTMPTLKKRRNYT